MRSREDRCMLEVWLPLLTCIALAWAWYHVLRLRERATAHARRLCQRHGLQLLDDSVALHRLRLRWRHGSLHALREYRFDTSPDGHDRQIACMTLLGDRLVSVGLPQSTRPAPAAPLPGIQPAAAHPSGYTDNVVPITRARQTLH
jgi:hypothetical protein